MAKTRKQRRHKKLKKTMRRLKGGRRPGWTPNQGSDFPPG